MTGDAANWSRMEPEAQLSPYWRFRDLLEAAPDAILEVDREGTIVLVNAAAERLFGYPREELLGQQVEILVPDSMRHRHTDHRDRYMEHPATRPMGSGLELFAKRRDGSNLPVEISLSPIRAMDAPRMIAIVRDITARKEAEARIAAMHQRFAAELAVTNQQLEARTREAEVANRLKSEFLASMSHELRTPLHTIIGFADLLFEEVKGPLNDNQKRFVGHIQRDSRHLLELINDILDLSKIEAGRLELSPEAFDAGDAIEETVSSLLPLAANKRISIRQNVSSVPITADRLRLKEILYNLVSNAVKFTPEEGSITVEAFALDDEFHCAVTDTGVGIPEQALKAIFDKFYQLGSTTKGVREGTGLGLAITKNLVELHRGRMNVASTVGKGSRFSFILPIEAPGAAACLSRTTPRGKTILLVSSDREHSEQLAGFLHDDGFTVWPAQSSQEAVREMGKNPDAAIIDLAALGTEGWNVIQQIRNCRAADSFPILAIAVTGAGGNAAFLGADVVLMKPVDPGALIRTVREHVRAAPGELARVLVVDDEPEARELIAESLRSIGLLPVLASGGKAALEALERGPINAAVVDLMMPEMSGFDLIARIRQNPARSGLPIIVLTGKEMGSDEMQLLAKEAQAVFLKGLDWKDGFLRKLSSFLNTALNP